MPPMQACVELFDGSVRILCVGSNWVWTLHCPWTTCTPGGAPPFPCHGHTFRGAPVAGVSSGGELERRLAARRSEVRALQLDTSQQGRSRSRPLGFHLPPATNEATSPPSGQGADEPVGIVVRSTALWGRTPAPGDVRARGGHDEVPCAHGQRPSRGLVLEAHCAKWEIHIFQGWARLPWRLAPTDGGPEAGSVQLGKWRSPWRCTS